MGGRLGLAGLAGLAILLAAGAEAGAVVPVTARKAAAEAVPEQPAPARPKPAQPEPNRRTSEATTVPGDRLVAVPTPAPRPSPAPISAPPAETRTVRKAEPAPDTQPAPRDREVQLAALTPPAAVEAPPPTPRVRPAALTNLPKPRPSEAAQAGAKGKAGTVFAADPEVPLSQVALTTAKKHGVDPLLVNAVILTESLYDPKALSNKGAMGLMQLIPKTAKRYGVEDAWNPTQNIDGGVRYLRDLLKMFGDIELALAAYNAGEEAVERYGRQIPPYAETQTYVARATSYLAKLQGGAKISRLRKTGSGVGGRLSGWGVIFGSFHSSGEAHSTITDRRRALNGVIAGGRPAVVRRKHEGNRPYAALLVGLNQDKAVAACKHLGGSGGYCLPIPPEQLRDPKALWR